MASALRQTQMYQLVLLCDACSSVLITVVLLHLKGQAISLGEITGLLKNSKFNSYVFHYSTLLLWQFLTEYFPLKPGNCFRCVMRRNKPRPTRTTFHSHMIKQKPKLKLHYFFSLPILLLDSQQTAAGRQHPLICQAWLGLTHLIFRSSTCFFCYQEKGVKTIRVFSC